LQLERVRLAGWMRDPDEASAHMAAALTAAGIPTALAARELADICAISEKMRGTQEVVLMPLDPAGLVLQAMDDDKAFAAIVRKATDHCAVSELAIAADTGAGPLRSAVARQVEVVRELAFDALADRPRVDAELEKLRVLRGELDVAASSMQPLITAPPDVRITESALAQLEYDLRLVRGACALLGQRRACEASVAGGDLCLGHRQDLADIPVHKPTTERFSMAANVMRLHLTADVLLRLRPSGLEELLL
jgi:hypothetical protein